MIAAYGEIMIRLSSGTTPLAQTDRLQLTVGGAEANVLAALAHWGHGATMITALPANPHGTKIIHTLRACGVDTRSIVQSEGRIGMYFLEEGSGLRPSNILYDRDNSVFSKTGDWDWEKLLDKCTWFHWTGITPALTSTTYQSLLLAVETARKKGMTVSADLNYRSTLWKWGKKAVDVVPSLIRMTDMLVTSEEAAAKMLGIQGHFTEEINPEQYQMLFDQLRNEYPQLGPVFVPVRRTITALHNRLTAFGSYQKNECVQGPTLDVPEIIDRVGSGDAMTAGFIHILKQKGSVHEALLFGLSAGAYKHYFSGDILQVDAHEIIKNLEGNARIQR